MDAETLRRIAVAIVTAAVLAFADTPLRTFGQRWSARRSRERFILLTVEIDLVALWAFALVALGWRAPLVPPAAASPAALAGLVLVAAGAALAVWAKFRLGAGFSATFGVKRGHVLVTDGPYALTRHPMYTGILAVVVGAALLWNLALTLALAATLAIAFHVHTVFEEDLFVSHFGEAYRDYRRRVPRLAPLPRPRGRAV